MASAPSGEPAPDVETVYQKAVQFLKITDELKVAPEILEQKYQELAALKDQLSGSIDELKKQSDTVLNK